MDSLVTLSITGDIEPDRLDVTFTVKNRLNETIIVYVYPDDGSREAALIGQAYISLAPENHELHMDLIPPKGPKNISWEVGLISLGKRLEGGASLEETITCELPVKEWSPYASDTYPEDSEPVKVTQIRMRTVWFPEKGVFFVQSGPEEGTVWSDGMPKHVIESNLKLPEPITVFRRTDEFHRF